MPASVSASDFDSFYVSTITQWAEMDKPGLLIGQLMSNMLTSTYGLSYFKIKTTWIIKNKRKSEKPFRQIVYPH